MKKNDINSKLKLALKAVGVVVILLLIVLTTILFLKNGEEIQNGQQDPGEINRGDEEAERTTILDIPSLANKEAFEILDILVNEYGEPEPRGLIEILKQEEEVKFQTLRWASIKYGYDFTFNFWTDGSLARKDSFYFTGHKNRDHDIDELLRLVNLEKEDPDYIFNISDLGGAIFNVGITPAKIARTPDPTPEEEEERLTREEVLEILQENAEEKHPHDSSRAKLEYENQLEAYEWYSKRIGDPDIIGVEVEKYPDILENAKKEWNHDYIMLKWQYERDVRAHEATL